MKVSWAIPEYMLLLNIIYSIIINMLYLLMLRYVITIV
jgi:hypothetical protein